MDNLVFAAVLLAAAAHAGWNAAIKRGLDPFTSTILISIGAGIVALAVLPAAGFPAAPAWPWLIASMIVHLGYFAGLAEAYRAGDMSQVYPLARGSAPLVTALISTTWLGETLGIFGWIGLLCLVCGVVVLSLRGDLAKFNRPAIGFALATAVTIVAYSLIDGIGGRLAGHANAYSATLFVGCGIVMTLYALLRRGPAIFVEMAPAWRTGLFGGALQFFSYGIAIWAMTVAPIAIVAALRETSVLFGAAIAVVILKEPVRAPRIVAAILIVTGLVMIRLY